MEQRRPSLAHFALGFGAIGGVRLSMSRLICLVLAQAQLARGQTPPDEPPPVGQPCVVSGGKCMCGSTDLSEFRGREIRTPADSDGYRYMFRMCEDITTAQLPEGCQPASGIPPLPHPAVVKWKDDTPMDCTMLGTFGPCTGVACGMTYQPAANGVAVTWQYEYGCYNTFRVFLTEGHQAAPQAAPFNDPVDAFPCYWTLHWASLGAFGGNPTLPGAAGAETHPVASFFLWLLLIFGLYLCAGPRHAA